MTDTFLPEERHGVWSSVATAVKLPPRYTVERILPHGIVFLVAPPKSSKTTVTLALACTVAGVKHEVLPDTLQKCPDPGRVLILNAEHGPGELRQIIEDGFRLELPDDDSIMAADDPWSWRLDDAGAVRTLLGWLETWKPKLFILDPLRDFHSLDEHDAGPMNRLLRPLQQWAKDNQSTLLVVHHTRKLGTDEDRNLRATDIRGTSALFGLADGVVTLTPKGRAGVHFDVVLKRGEPWEETLKLGAWGTHAAPKMGPVELRVFESICSEPALTQEQRSKQLAIRKAAVSEAVRTLSKLGALGPDGQPTEAGRSLARSVAASLSRPTEGA